MKAGRACTVCRHPDKARIELGRAAGASLGALAKKYKVGKDAVARHWASHVSPEAKASLYCGPAQLDELAQRAAAEGDSLLDYLRIVRTTLLSSLVACSEVGDGRAVATVAGALIATLDKIGRLTGQIAAIAQGSVNVNIALVESPAYARMQAEILRALAPFAEARAAVVDALRRIDAEDQAGPKLIEHAT